MLDDNLIFVFTPSLVATLLNREEAKGEPLTEAEVISIRDQCQCIAAPVDVALKMNEARGYDDIDPENCWPEWQRRRLSLIAHRDREK